MSSDDDSNVDNVSVISLCSSSRLDGYGSDAEDGVKVDENGDEIYDDFEDKLVEAIDNASEKSAKTRQTALEVMKKAFTSRYLFNFIFDRKITLVDIFERSLKRGKGEEQSLAATLTAIVCSTLGAEEDTDVLFRDVQVNLLTMASDNSVSAPTRSKCITALGLCVFITNSGNESIDAIMEFLLTVFSGSFLKGNGTVPNLNPQTTALHASALLAWCLLATVQPVSTVLKLTEKHIKRIIELLDSQDVDLRIAAGEVIAVLHEVSRELDDSFEVDNADGLYEKLRQLATDSQKFRAKKDRRIQRSSFRDVLKACENNDSPSVVVKFGHERLMLDSWCKKRQYEAFCQIFGSGMNKHLTENDLIRDIFSLGSPLSFENGTKKISKFERHMGNLAASKARTKCRNKLRSSKVSADLY